MYELKLVNELENVAANTLCEGVVQPDPVSMPFTLQRVRTYSHLSLDYDTSTTNRPAMGIGHNIKTIIAYFTGW